MHAQTFFFSPPPSLSAVFNDILRLQDWGFGVTVEDEAVLVLSIIIISPGAVKSLRPACLPSEL